MARIKRRIRRMNFLTQRRRIEPIKETTDKYMKDEFLGRNNNEDMERTTRGSLRPQYI
jgi:hypothetical protein